MSKAIFAGSFDPPTIGHLDVIERSLKLFDKLVIAVLHNPEKISRFTLEERLFLLKGISEKFEEGKIEIVAFDGLLVDLVERLKVYTLIRGVRDNYDFRYEVNMADTNHKLNDKIETVFLPTKPENRCVCSETVRHILSFNGDISAFVPKCILCDIKNIIGGYSNES